MSRRGAPDVWKAAMPAIMHMMDLSYGRFSELLGSAPRLLALGGLDAPPEASTLRKFSYRVPKHLLDILLYVSAESASRPWTVLGIDGTGFIDTNASAHYERRVHQILKLEPAAADREGLAYCCTAVRGFPKATIAGDTDTLCIYACDVVFDHSADVRRMIPLLEMLEAMGLDPDAVLADRGYDAEYIHRCIRENLRAESVIPARRREPARLGNPGQIRRGGFFRRRMATEWDEHGHLYSRRGLIECINSKVKRVCGDAVRSRRPANKSREIALKCLAHNMRRLDAFHMI